MKQSQFYYLLRRGLFGGGGIWAKYVNDFKARVIADGGTMESPSCAKSDVKFLVQNPEPVPTPATDADYQAVLDRSTALGYTAPSASQQTLQNTLVTDLKTAGVWDKLDLFYVFATDGDSDYATLNWKAPSSHQVTKVSSPTFTADSGFSGDGSTAYLDTNFSIANDATNYTQNNASTFTYFVSDLSQTDFVAYGARNDVDPNKVRNQLRMRSTDYRPAINDDRPIIAADYRSNNWHHQKRTASTGFTTFLDSTSFTNTISSKDISDLDFSMRLLTLHFKTTGGTSNLFGSAEGTMKVFGLGEALDNTDLKDAIDTYISAL
jgi:hypothetical protein